MSLKPKVQKARTGLVRRLSRIDPTGKVLTVYVDLDPSEFATPPARETQINSLASEAEALVEELDSDARKPLREDVRLVREFLLGDEDWSSDAGSVAIFASSTDKLFEVLKLPEPLPRGVFVDDRPYVEPMKDMVEQCKWCVALIDRRTARLFVGSPVSLTEYDDQEGGWRGQHSQGGWSQARFERVVEEDVEDHLKEVADRLLQLHQSRNFDYFVIGALDELWPRIEERLHPYVAEKVVGRIDVDIQVADVEELKERLKEIEVQQDLEREKALLAELYQGLANDGRAAAGLPQVLRNLNESRVGTVLAADGFDAEGTWCPQCGYLSESAQECPLDRTRMEHADSILSRAMDKTEEIAAEWVTVTEPDRLADQGSIAALLRF